MARQFWVKTECLVLAMVLALVVGCSTKSGSSYTPDEAGKTMSVSHAQVLSSRAITIEGLKDNRSTGWGTLIGATIAGAATYGLTEADTPLGAAVTIIAAVGGALVGTMAEEYKNKFPGAEYILSPKKGQSYAVVQTMTGDDKIMARGTKVVVIRSRSGIVRVVPDKK